MNKTNVRFVMKNLVRIYELAKAGLGDVKVAEAVGVSYPTFKRWKDRLPEVKAALKEARQPQNGGTTVQDYVFHHLPDHLKKVWDELVVCYKGHAIDRMEAVLEDCGRKGRQHLFLYALLRSNYNAGKACRMVNISKKELNGWIVKDPDFAELIEEVDWHKGNFFEEQYVKLVKSGHPAAVIQANKTYNAHRGYGEKKTVTKNVNVSGNVGHVHTAIPIEELNLDLEARKQLLRALRERQQEQNPEEENVE